MCACVNGRLWDRASSQKVLFHHILPLEYNYPRPTNQNVRLKPPRADACPRMRTAETAAMSAVYHLSVAMDTRAIAKDITLGKLRLQWGKIACSVPLYDMRGRVNCGVGLK